MASFHINRFYPLWEDVAPKLGRPDGVDSRIAARWSLVLQSQGIAHTMPFGKGGRRIIVYSWDAEEACRQIRHYLLENPPPLPEVEKVRGDPLAVLMVGLYMAFLLCIHVLSRTFYPDLNLYPAKLESFGRLDSGLLLSGEYWRAFTAVTLHGDAAHVFGNIVIGGVLITALAHRIGAGGALFSSFCCAAAANLLNAYFHGPGFYAVGFSGAVFAATGLLAAIEAFSRSGEHRRQAFVSVAAGLSLLAALGTGGENTDLGGHFLGFILGMVAGGGLRMFKKISLPGGQATDFVLYLCSLSLPLMAWGRAFMSM